MGCDWPGWCLFYFIVYILITPVWPQREGYDEPEPNSNPDSTRVMYIIGWPVNRLLRRGRERIPLWPLRAPPLLLAWVVCGSYKFPYWLAMLVWVLSRRSWTNAP